MRKPAFCIRENKDADQLRGNREADQCLCFRHIDSTILLLPMYKISSLQPSPEAVQPGLCGTWSETPKTGFLTTRLICRYSLVALIRVLLMSVHNLWRIWQNFVQNMHLICCSTFSNGMFTILNNLLSVFAGNRQLSLIFSQQ